MCGRVPLTKPPAAATSGGMDGDPTAIDALSFEEALRRLEEIGHRLEAGEASLEDSIDLYTQGEALKAHCQAKLAAAQARIERIQIGSDGKPAGVQPLDRKSVV